MTRPEQKAAEREAIEHFLKRLEIVCGHLDDGPDPPDFIAKIDGKPIGIEVSDYHWSQERRKTEESAHRFRTVSDQVREEFPELRNLSVHLELKEIRFPPDRDFEEFARQIAEFCKERLVDLTDDFSYFDEFGPSRTLMIEFLKEIRLKPVKCFMHWDTSLMIGAVGLTEAELFHAISKKIKTKRPECEEFWLFLVEGWNISQIMCIAFVETLLKWDSVNKVLEGSSYDQVFLCGSEVRRWVRDEGWEELIGLDENLNDYALFR